MCNSLAPLFTSEVAVTNQTQKSLSYFDRTQGGHLLINLIIVVTEVIRIVNNTNDKGARGAVGDFFAVA